MFYILGLKLNKKTDAISPYQVEQQILISTQKGFDDNSVEQMQLGFVVQGPKSNASCLGEKESLEEAIEFVHREYDVFDMGLPDGESSTLNENVKKRYGVKRLSKGDLATFDFSPPEFGGKPYEPIKLEKGCDLLIISDDKGHLLSEYMKAAIGGLGGNIDSPSLDDLSLGKNALKELGFKFEGHHSPEWGITILVGKEPQLV